MEYTVSKLARLSGVTARTLRYYDEIGLLRPAVVRENGYRVYRREQVDRLQQILLYRELGVELEEIGRLLTAPDFHRQAALEQHLRGLEERRAQTEALIENVRRTLRALKGEKEMTDKEKFEGFKKKLVEDNRRDYGAEVREKYGEEAAAEADRKVMGMSQEQWEKAEELRLAINDGLRAAVETGDPAGEAAQKVCQLHRQWLCLFWGQEKYSKQAHLGLAEMYVADERFRDYYGAAAEGAAEFLRDALKVYCG